jgi:hypothetical protein
MNNFDTSSTGVNLELSCFFDGFRSQSDFSNNFHTVQHESYHDHHIVAFCFEGNLDVSELEKSYNVDVSSQELFEKYFNHYFDKDYSLATEDQIKDLIQELHCDYDVKPIAECKIEVLLKAIKCNLGYDQKELNHFLEQSGFEPEFEMFESRGYCQGDYTQVLFYKELLDLVRKELPQCEKMTNTEIVDYFKEDIHHYLWDSPITCTLTIDNDTDSQVFLSESLNSEYTFEPNEIISDLEKTLVHDKKDIIIEWLKENLPVTPEHVS